MGRGSRIIGDKCLQGGKEFTFPGAGFFMDTLHTSHFHFFFLCVFFPHEIPRYPLIWYGMEMIEKKFGYLFFLFKRSFPNVRK